MHGSTAQPRSWQRRLLRAIAIYAGMPYLLVTVGFVALQRRLLYPATRVERLPTPQVAEGRLSTIEIPTYDGLTLRGWLLADDAAAASPAKAPDRRPIVLCFPGNSEDRRSRLSEMQEFRSLGCDVLLCDYRGYGDNPGSPNETDLHRDAATIWRFTVDQLGRPPGRILLFGESLGGAVAVRLAADRCAAGTPPLGLVVSSTFDSMPSVVRRMYPLFPFRWLLLDTYRSDRAISRVTCPLAVLHGDEDEITPIEHGRRLFAAAPERAADGRAKQFIELPGRGHNDVPRGTLSATIRQLLPTAGMELRM